MTTYVRSLANPFDTTVAQPKILDGKLDRTAGMRHRVTGNVSCKTSGDTFFILHRGGPNVLSWFITGSLNGSTLVEAPTKLPPLYQGLLDPNLRQLRLISAGLKLSLLNSADQADGIFEAIRVNNMNGVVAVNGANAGTIIMNEADCIAACTDMANNESYISGRLRDINRYMFRLNWRDFEVPFYPPQASLTTNNPAALAYHDTVIIRIRGRQVTTEPSVIMYDAVATHQMEYNDGTALGRLMTRDAVTTNHDELFNRMNIKKAGIRI